MQMVVLDAGTLWFEEDAWAPVAALGELTLHEGTFSDEDTIKRCAGAKVAMTNKVPFPREVIEALPELKCISTLATGYNTIDLEAARERGIVICNVPAYGTDSVAQHALAMLMHWTNGIALHAESVRAGDWIQCKQFAYLLQPIRELSDLVIGIVGFGDIGRRFGEMAHHMGATILASRRTPREAPNWDRFNYAQTSEIFARADVVSLHCPLTPDTAHMVNADVLRTMKPSSLLINTSRGGLVQEHDLAAALEEGIISGAFLDVVDGEPMHADNPLRTSRNCWITPHIAWGSERARHRLIAETVGNLEAFMRGSPRNVVS